MQRFKYYICERDLLCLARGDFDKIKWFMKKPKRCVDAWCDQDIVALFITVENPNSDDQNRHSGKKMGNLRKKRQGIREKVSRVSRNRNSRRQKDLHKKIKRKRRNSNS